MGRDMYAHIEVKYNGDWHHYAAPSVDRDKRLFDLFVARGQTSDIPYDASVVTKHCYELAKRRYEPRNVCVVRSGKLPALQDAIHDAYGEPRNIARHDLEYNIFRTYVDEGTLAEHSGFDDLRVVCWFDN